MFKSEIEGPKFFIITESTFTLQFTFTQANVAQSLHDHCGPEERTNPADLPYIGSTGCQSKTSVIL